MKRTKTIFNSLLLTLTFALMGMGGFLMENQFTHSPATAFAESNNYDEITNSLPNYLDINTKINDVDEKIFLFSGNNEEFELTIANDTKIDPDMKENYCYYLDENNKQNYYYFYFPNSLSLRYDITNTELENGETGINLIDSYSITDFTTTHENSFTPNGVSFTPNQLKVKFKLGETFGVDTNTKTITLKDEGCYTLSIPVIVYMTTNDWDSFKASEETINYTFMVFKTSTYFNQSTLRPNIATSNNIQQTPLQNASDYSIYYHHSYSKPNSDSDDFTLPTFEFNPNVYQFKIFYTDTNQKIKTTRIEYTDKFIQYDENNNIIEESDYFVWTSIQSKSNDKAKLVFNDLGTYDIEISYLYKSGKNKLYSVPLEKLPNTIFANKLQRLYIYGYQAFYSNYNEIDPITHQPVSRELKTLDTENATFSQSADITMGVNKQRNESVSNPTSDSGTKYDLDELLGDTNTYIKNKAPVSTNQTPIKFMSNATADSGNSGLWKLTKNSKEEWEAESETFSLYNQNTPGVYLYIIQYKFDEYMLQGQAGSLQYHYQIFFFEVTNLAPTVTLYEHETNDDKISQLYTRGYTNKSVYIVDNSTRNPYDAKVSITLTAYDYVNKLNYIKERDIESFAETTPYKITYKTFGEGDPDDLNGKRGLYIERQDNFATKFTIQIKANKQTSPSMTSFTIDTSEIGTISARKVSETSGANYSIKETISNKFTNEPIIFSWKEKASQVPTYGYLKYIPLEDNNFYDKKDLNTTLRTLLNDENNLLPINYKIDLSKASTWIEYKNTNESTIFINAGAVKQNNGFYLLEVYDEAGNVGFEIFLIDKTAPLFVKQQEELENGTPTGIITRTFISNGENIDIAEDTNYDITIKWAKYKGIFLVNTDSDIKTYSMNKNKANADKALKEMLDNFFTSSDLTTTLNGIDGTFLKIETFPTYYALNNDSYQAYNGYNYGVVLSKTNDKGEIEAIEGTHSILTRDSSNTKNYEDNATNYKNAPSGILNFRVSADASKLDVKIGDKPTATDTMWQSLQWSNHSFTGNLNNNNEPISPLNPTTNETDNQNKFKYSYIQPTNNKNKLTLSYIPLPSNGSVVEKITLKYYAYERKHEKNGNTYFYYTLSKEPTKEYDIYENNSVTVAKGEELTFEIILGVDDYPVAGQYVIERVYSKNNTISRFDYLKRTITFIVDPYNVISPIENIEDDQKNSLESLIGGDILVSMYSGEGQQEIEISFPRYIDGLNQGSFYTQTSFKEEESFPNNAISVSGNKLPLSLLIPQHKYTISSKKDDSNNSYSVTDNNVFSYFDAELKYDEDKNSWKVCYEGVEYKEFSTEEDALAEISKAQIRVYELYARIQYYQPNSETISATYHGGNINALTGKDNIYSNGYMNFYRQLSTSQSQTLLLETNPTKQFTQPGKYVVTLYQANNLGASFEQLYSLYKFAFQIEETSPKFNIVDNAGYSIEEHNNAYYTNSSKLTIQWQIPNSDYTARIDEKNIIIGGSLSQVIENIEGDTTAGGTRYFELDTTNMLSQMANSDELCSITITMQFEGDNNNIYKKTTKTIYFDITAPHERVLNLMANVESSACLQSSTSSILKTSTLHNLTREYYDYNSNAVDFGSVNGISYSYIKSTGTLKDYYFTVQKDFISSLAIDNNAYGVKYIGLKEINDLTRYTPADKDSFNERNYKEFDEIDVNSLTSENPIFEVVERDWAGNMTVYLIKVITLQDGDSILTYKNNNTKEDKEIQFTNQQMRLNNNNLYSNTGFEIQKIGYNNDEWEIFSVKKAGEISNIYMKSPWLDDNMVYLFNNQNFEAISMSSIFSGMKSSNRKHEITFANRDSGSKTNLYLTIYNTDLIAETSYTEPQAQLSIRVPSQESLNSTTYGYIFPVEIKVERLEGVYTDVAIAKAVNGLYGEWNVDCPSNSVEVGITNGRLLVKTTITSNSEKLRYTITDNFGNKTMLIQLANILPYSEILSSGAIYSVTESDNSKTYISTNPITFNYHTKLYFVKVYNETDKRTATGDDYQYTNVNNIISLTFSKTNKCYTITVYDSADTGANATPLKSVHIRLYDKLPKFSNSADLENGGVTFLDRNLKAFNEDKIQIKSLSTPLIVNGKEILNPQVTYLSTYSSVVTMKYTNSPIDNGKINAYEKEFPYSAYVSYDDGQTFVKLDTQSGTYSSCKFSGEGDYIILFTYDDENILASSYKAYMITIWNSDDSYYSITIDGVKVERSKQKFTDENGVQYDTNYLVGIDYSNKNRVIITLNEELGVKLSTPIVKTTGTNVYVEIYSYTCSSASRHFTIIYIKPNNSFTSLFNYESPSGASESIINKSNETVVAGINDEGFDKLKLTFTPYYGIESNRINLKVEKMFEGNFIDVSPEVNYSETFANAYITRAGYYRISLYDSCEPANYQSFNGNNYMYLYFLNSVPFVVTTIDAEGHTQTTEAIQNAIYNSSVTISLTNLSSFYSSPSNYPQITVYRNGKIYGKSTGGSGYIEKNYTYTFNEAGYYQVEFLDAKSAKNNTPIRSKAFNFMIVSKNESRSSFNFSAYASYYITKIEKLGLGNITSDFIEFGSNKNIINVNNSHYLSAVSLDYLDEKTGAGRYTITICPNEPAYESVGVKEFTFSIWINQALPPISVSIGQGQSTTNNITITFNVANFYKAVGDSYIKIGNMTKNYNAETISDLEEIETLTISQSGTYYIQVYTASGQLLYSYKVIKNEPLNAFAIIMIVIGVIALGVIIFITIKLRKRQRVK